MCLYVRDPADNSTSSLKQTKKINAEYKREMEVRDVILPSTVDYATGLRTELIIDIIDRIPKESLNFSQILFQHKS